jgi:hypothetical protein
MYSTASSTLGRTLILVDEEGSSFLHFFAKFFCMSNAVRIAESVERLIESAGSDESRDSLEEYNFITSISQLV